MVKGLDFNPFARFNGAALAFRTIKQLPRLKELKMCDP
jgi:hypothetical protein